MTIPSALLHWGITVEEVRRLAERGVLRSRYDAWDPRQVVVQPALVSGWTA